MYSLSILPAVIPPYPAAGGIATPVLWPRHQFPLDWPAFPLFQFYDTACTAAWTVNVNWSKIHCCCIRCSHQMSHACCGTKVIRDAFKRFECRISCMRVRSFSDLSFEIRDEIVTVRVLLHASKAFHCLRARHELPRVSQVLEQVLFCPHDICIWICGKYFSPCSSEIRNYRRVSTSGPKK